MCHTNAWVLGSEAEDLLSGIITFLTLPRNSYLHRNNKNCTSVQRLDLPLLRQAARGRVPPAPHEAEQAPPQAPPASTHLRPLVPPPPGPLPRRMLLLDEVGRAFGHHDHSGVEVRADDVRDGGRVRDAQPSHPAHPQPRVQHRARVCSVTRGLDKAGCVDVLCPDPGLCLCLQHQKKFPKSKIR
ncbi:Myosin-5 [Frankliniella fusca]|uniref:Myosin-5 n=1 Tax=Frankliniella fusca TaxID=407009 RepID=A0AAE1GP88_9NEOP|nr:Myosin-5 [Frankliniella fusca]